MPKLRVIIVDDSAVIRRAFTKIIESDQEFDLVGTACNGQDALEKIEKFSPDLVTLDIEMPKMTGLEALEKIVKLPAEKRPAVLMCSSLTVQGSTEAIKAMHIGAEDFIAKELDEKTREPGESVGSLIIEKLRAIGRSRRGRLRSHDLPKDNKPIEVPTYRSADFDAICIGSSTGGPPVLETILSAIPSTMPLPIVVAQHMPNTFTKSLAERLNKSCSIKVFHGEDKMPLLPGTAIILPGGQHGLIEKAGSRSVLRVTDEPVDAPYKPSVDVLLSSAASALGKRCLGVVATGMGEDGKLGAIDLHAAGGKVLTQSSHSCVVYGMPRAVDEAGCSAAKLCPDDLARVLATLLPARVRRSA